MGRACRRGGKWFSFDLPVDPTHPMALVATYNRDEWQRTDFRALDRWRKTRRAGGRGSRTASSFLMSNTPCLRGWWKGKSKVTVRFQATGGNQIAAVFGLRMIRQGLK